MTVRLCEVTQENWIECIKLTTNSSGKLTIFEEYVASNAVSLAQSKVDSQWIPRAIYYGDQMVGFAMYGYSESLSGYEVCRLMIDHRYQGQGYGRAALQLVLQEMINAFQPTEILLSTNPLNTTAIGLYSSLGFEDTGRTIVGNHVEIIMRLKVQ